MRKWFKYEFDWVIFTMVVVCVGLLTGAGFIVYGTINDYRAQCHDAGGHIIEVQGDEVCVDHDNRVIFV